MTEKIKISEKLIIHLYDKWLKQKVWNNSGDIMDLCGGTNGFAPALSVSTLRVKKTGETASQYVSFCRSICALLPFKTAHIASRLGTFCRSIRALFAFNR